MIAPAAPTFDTIHFFYGRYDPDPRSSERRRRTPLSATNKRFRVTFHADDAGESAWGRDPLPCETLR